MNQPDPINLNQRNLNDRRQKIIELANADVVARAEQNVSRLLMQQGSYYIRLKADAAKGVIEEGRYKTLFEVGASRAANQPGGNTD